ncbi:MAG: GGDEF domain-containing protein, partial [Candidatus Adiutrix sp.]|nr:GGDEF domain-containing protein [Candidatus Adiutrix sp.]
RLDIPAQVIAVTGEPDFGRAMDWVAGGVFNVLGKPLDETRLRRLVMATVEHCETFKAVLKSAKDDAGAMPFELSRSLVSFYHGLAGRLDRADVKKYIIDSVKKLCGARRVELSLTEELSGSSYCLETNTVILNDDPARVYFDASQAPAMKKPLGSRISFDLHSGDQMLGELILYFDQQSDLAIRHRETLLEVASAASAALSSVAKYQKAVNMAARDSLTGLYNRRIFSEVLHREFAQAQRHNFDLSLLSLDLDHFKSVNDNFGHQTGDKVLKAVARAIADVARGSDLPARVGGEEFAIILPHTNQDQAYVLAERLRKILAESPFNISGAAFRQTISQGIAGTEHFMVKSAEDMVYWADQALYLAKREGRDAIRSVTDLPMAPAMKDRPYAFQ